MPKFDSSNRLEGLLYMMENRLTIEPQEDIVLTDTLLGDRTMSRVTVRNLDLDKWKLMLELYNQHECVHDRNPAAQQAWDEYMLIYNLTKRD